jgi:hypothetical protein
MASTVAVRCQRDKGLFFGGLFVCLFVFFFQLSMFSRDSYEYQLFDIPYSATTDVLCSMIADIQHRLKHENKVTKSCVLMFQEHYIMLQVLMT